MNGLYFQRIGRGNRPPHVVTLDFTDIEQRVLDALRAPYRVLSLNEVHFLLNLDKDWETPCPNRGDMQHCECWYDGGHCCACGDPGSCPPEET